MSRIELRTAENVKRALERLAISQPNAFDFVLLDDNRQADYLEDYELCVRLLRSGGLMIITDV